jgi:hypothetical protein
MSNFSLRETAYGVGDAFTSHFCKDLRMSSGAILPIGVPHLRVFHGPGRNADGDPVDPGCRDDCACFGAVVRLARHASI